MASNLGARKNAKFKAVCTAPSFNKTPVGPSTPPIPYPVTQDLGSSVGVVPTVKFNRDPAYVLNNSTQPSCKGDAPGVAKGVKSSTTSGEVKPVKGSSTVRVGGQPIIRDGDPCTLNKGNCPGVYTTAPGANGTIQGGAPTADTNPKSGGWFSGLVHGVLGVASFIPGVSVVTGALDAALYAAEGNYTEAALAAASMIPGGKVATTVGKVAVKVAQGVQKANAAVGTAQGVVAAVETVASGGPIDAAGVVEAVAQVAMGRKGKGKTTGFKVKDPKSKPKKKKPCKYCRKDEHPFPGGGWHTGSGPLLAGQIFRNKDISAHTWFTGLNSLQAHHIIPIKSMKPGKWKTYCSEFGYNINHKNNGVMLPAEMALACQLHAPRHRGNHEAGKGDDVSQSYMEGVKIKIDKVATAIQEGKYCAKPKAAVKRLDEISRDILVKIDAFTWTITSDGKDYGPYGKGCGGVSSLKTAKETCPKGRNHGLTHKGQIIPKKTQPLKTGE